jgi:hypothetical protein
MHTFVLSPQTASLPVRDLLQHLANDSVEVRDPDGNIVAYVLSPVDREALIYAEAKLDLDRNRDELQQSITRRGGITTKQLLEKAQAIRPVENSSS